MGGLAYVGGEVAVAINLSAANPHFHPDTSVAGMSLGVGIINIGAEGVQGGSAFLVRFGTGDFGAVYAACNRYLDAFSTHAHAGLNGHLGRAAVRNTAFNLAGNSIGNQARIEFGALDLENIDLHVLRSELLQFLFQLVHLSTGFTDDDTGAGGIDGDGYQFQGTLNYNF